MTQYAYFDHSAPAPAKVNGWYDTGEFPYLALPSSVDLLPLTPTQWADAQANPNGWAVSSGTLVAYTPPAPVLTLAQQAQVALGAGVAVTSTGTPALNGTYPIDPLTQGRIASVSTYILVNGKFPGSATTYAWVDVAGAAHVFPSTAAFQAFATAIADHVSILEQIVFTGTGTLPVATVAIA
jgi:hypothetical protein